MSACLLLDPFLLYLEMSVVFALSIYTATAKRCRVGNENVLLLVSTLGTQQPNVVCCHNDTLAVALPGFLTISSVSRIVNVMCIVVLATACLLILGSLGSNCSSSVDSVQSRLQNMKSQYQCA